MPQTLLAMFNDYDEASRALDALANAGFTQDQISVISGDTRHESTGRIQRSGEDVKPGEGAGFGAVVGTLVGLGAALIPGVGPIIAAGPAWAVLFAGIGAASGAATGGITAGLIDMGVHEEHAQIYEDSLRRGGTLISVHVITDNEADRAEAILSDFGAVDLEHQHESNYQDTQPMKTNAPQGSIPSAASGKHSLDVGDEERLEVVEEELQVGKREVERGSVRIRKYVTETPVQQDVTLREEHVNIERRSVDRPMREADYAFNEQTIEVHERGEVPVISKTARVIEEVIVSKEITEHTETISDTVRRTDVEIEEDTSLDYNRYDNDFRTHYTTNYTNSGYTYDQFTPAYRYGYNLATTAPYRGRTWTEVETDARTRWEERNPGTWEQFKDSIQQAWDRVTGEHQRNR